MSKEFWSKAAAVTTLQIQLLRVCETSDLDIGSCIKALLVAAMAMEGVRSSDRDLAWHIENITHHVDD